MKAKIRIIALVALVLSGLSLKAQNKQDTKTVTYECSMTCKSCEEKIMKNIAYEKGVRDLTVSYEQKKATVTFKTSKNTDDGIKKAIEKLGYEVEILGSPVTFGVKGNCGMCKTTIEKAAMSIYGVKFAQWDKDKKVLSIVVDEQNVVIDNVHEAIAAAGYDTDLQKSDDGVYSNLPQCCKYDR